MKIRLSNSNEKYQIVDTEGKFGDELRKINNYAAVIAVLLCIDNRGKITEYGMWTAKKIK